MSEKTRGMVGVDQPVENEKQLRTNHLLIIGIDQYSDPNFRNLQNAKKDAQDFKKLMLEQYQFTEENTTCLFDEAATRENILDEFQNHLNELGENDNLLFYYSGHGEIVKSGRRERGYWIPCDGVFGKTSTLIQNTSIKQLFYDSYAHHIFGIVDSCFSGSLFVGNRSSVEKRLNSLTSRWLLTAGLLEPVSDGSLGDNSPFAKTLLSHLRGNPDNALWSSDLCLRVLKSVADNTREQTPRGEPLHGVGHMGGQFIFRKKGFFGKVESDDETTASDSNPARNANFLKGEKEKSTKDISNEPKKSEVANDFNDWRNIMKNFITEDLRQSMVSLNAAFNRASSKYNDLILLRARLNSALTEMKRGVVTTQQSTMVQNQIRYALIELIDDMEEEDLKHFKIQK